MDTVNSPTWTSPDNNQDNQPERQDAKYQVRSVLRRLARESKGTPVDFYLDEVVRCCRVGALHAASLTLWCALSHHLRTQMAWIGLDVLDAELRRYKSGRYLAERQLRTESDMRRMEKLNEEAAVAIAQRLGLIDGGLAAALQKFRGQRNNVAHQSWPGISIEDLSSLLSQKNLIDLLLCSPTAARISMGTILNRLECPGYEDEDRELRELVKRVKETERLQLAKTLYTRYLFGERPKVEPTSDSSEEQVSESEGNQEPRQMLPVDNTVYYNRALTLWNGVRYTLRRQELAALMRDLARTLERQFELEQQPYPDAQPRPIVNPVTPLIFWRFLREDSEELAPTEVTTLLRWAVEEVTSFRIENLNVQSTEMLVRLIRCVPIEPDEELVRKVVRFIVRCWCESEGGWYTFNKNVLAEAIVVRGNFQLLNHFETVVQERLGSRRLGEREQDLLNVIQSARPTY